MGGSGIIMPSARAADVRSIETRMTEMATIINSLCFMAKLLSTIDDPGG